MNNISEIVNVTINRETKGVSRTGFGIPLILGYHARFPEVARSYTSFEGVQADFESSDPEYAKAQAIFGQDLQPESIVIGRASSNVNVDIVSLDVTKDYEFKLNGITITYSPAGPDAKSDVVDGLILAIIASGEPVTATDNGDDFDIVADVAGVDFTIENSDVKMEIVPYAHESTLTFDIDFELGNLINLLINGNPITQVAWDTDQATTIANLATAIQASGLVLSAVVTPTKIITIVANSNIIISLEDIVTTGGSNQAVGVQATTETFQNQTPVEALTAIKIVNDDWYFLLYAIGRYDIAGVTILAASIETQLKLFFNLTIDPRMITTSTDDIGSILNALSYDRSIVVYTGSDDNHIEAGWVGQNAPKDPGSITWKFKSLSGVTADTFTPTEKTNVKGKEVNLYNEIGGIDIMEEGVVISGEFIDIMRGADWIQVRMEEKVFGTLANQPKVPYTDSGVDIVKSDVSSILQLAIGQGILADDPAPVVTAPEVADISTADKQARILRNVEFTATFAGAIHKVIIEGFISV